MATLFTTQAPPGTGDTLNASDSVRYTLGMAFYADSGGTISAVRYYRGTSASWDLRNVAVAIWDAAGTLLGSGTRQQQVVATDPVGWITIPLTAPVTILANTRYIVGYNTPTAGHYVYTAAAFTTQIDNAPLHAFANTTSIHNGLLHSPDTVATFPTVSANGTNFFADIVFTAVAQPSFDGAVATAAAIGIAGEFSGTPTFFGAVAHATAAGIPGEAVQVVGFSSGPAAATAAGIGGIFQGAASSTFLGALATATAVAPPGAFGAGAGGNLDGALATATAAAIGGTLATTGPFPGALATATATAIPGSLARLSALIVGPITGPNIRTTITGAAAEKPPTATGGNTRTTITGAATRTTITGPGV